MITVLSERGTDKEHIKTRYRMGETTRKCRCVLFKIGQSKELRRKYDIRQSDLRWAGGR